MTNLNEYGSLQDNTEPEMSAVRELLYPLERTGGV